MSRSRNQKALSVDRVQEGETDNPQSDKTHYDLPNTSTNTTDLALTPNTAYRVSFDQGKPASAGSNRSTNSDSNIKAKENVAYGILNRESEREGHTNKGTDDPMNSAHEHHYLRLVQ